MGKAVVNAETDFRRNARSDLGTRTATLDKFGIAKLRANWIYRVVEATPRRTPRANANQ